MMCLEQLGARFARPEHLAEVLDEVIAAAVAITRADKGDIQLGCEASPRGAAPEGARIARPLLGSSGRQVGTLSTYYRPPRRPDEQELQLLDHVARLAADVIERAEAEEALREANEELQESNRRKVDFLAVLAHELRNPLASIKNNMALLDCSGAGSPTADHARDVIRRQADQLARLVDDLFDIGRIDHGKIVLHRRRLDLRDVVCFACEDARRALEGHAVALRLDLPTQPVWVDADPTRLMQVVGNLLANAAKFTTRGTVDVALSVRGGSCELRVRDTGAGIDPGLVERIFEPFAQAEGARETGGGMGIGLALVKSLVTLHGGRVAASSEGVGRGAEFVVALPLAPAPA
jgi:signal transduction histidine kinase